MKKQKNSRSMDRLKASPLHIGIDTLLPTEITTDILSRLPFESILECKQVCKTWRNLINHPSFTHTLHLLRRLDDHCSAASSGKMGFIFLSCLAKNRGKELNYVEYDVKDDQPCKTPTRINLHIPSDASFIVGSCNGLICISLIHQGRKDYLYDPVFICNPITRECVNLRRLQLDIYKEFRDAIVSGFGYHPSTNEFKVVRIYYPDLYSLDRPRIGLVEVCTLGSGSGSGSGWRKKGEITYSLGFHHRSSSGIFVNGALHWLDSEGNIVAFDLANEEFRLLSSSNWFYPHGYGVTLRLFQGSLCLVDYKSHSINIWSLKKNNEWKCIFTIDTEKLDMRNRRWEKMFDIDSKYGTGEIYWPFAHTEKGEVLLCYRYRFFCRCDPKTSTLKNIIVYNTNSTNFQIIPHLNSFVSLRALLEEDGKMIGLVERAARKFYLIY